MQPSSDKIRENETYILKSIKFEMAKNFGASVLENLHVDIVKRDLVDTFTVRVYSMIFGQQMPLTYTVSVSIPKNWWEHFKRDHMPRWWTVRWPVKHMPVYRDVTFNHWALLPKFDKVPPGEEIQMFTEDYFDEPEIPEDA